MRESITLQVGQCGNQIGKEFWDKISYEHGITQSGTLAAPKHCDRKDVFFYETDDNKFIPRSILIDLEPRAIQNITNSGITHENIFLDANGGGAGNNWAHGYARGRELQNDIFDMIQREAEACDDMDSFMLFHSIAGGTGSGLGSLMLENLRDYYPKKIIQSYSIFPNNDEVSDVVVQPYNSMLTLQRLSLCCDSVIAIDNTSLTKINNGLISGNKNKQQESFSMNFSMVNMLVGSVIAASTSTIRFPTYIYSDLRSLNSVLIPVEKLKFVIPSYTPFTLNNRLNRKTDCQDIMRKLLLPNSRLVTTDVTRTNQIISMVSILQGVTSLDVQKSIFYAFERECLNFVKWMPPSFHVVRSNVEGLKSGISLTNDSSFSGILTKIADQFDRLKKKNAFIDMYKKYSHDLTEFEECREVVQTLIDAYNNI